MTAARVVLLVGALTLVACGRTKAHTATMRPTLGGPSYYDLLAHCDPWFPRLSREPERKEAAHLFALAKVADQFGAREEALPLCQRFLARKASITLPTAFAWCEDLMAQAQDH